MVRPFSRKARGGEVGRTDGPDLLHAQALRHLVEGAHHVAQQAERSLFAQGQGQGVEAKEIDESHGDVGEGARGVMPALAHLGSARGRQQALEQALALLGLGLDLGLLRLQVADHPVEGVPEGTEFGILRRRDLGVAVALPDPLGGGGQGADRAGDPRGVGDGDQGAQQGQADRRHQGLGGIGADGCQGLLLVDLGDHGPAQGVQVHRPVGGEDRYAPVVPVIVVHPATPRQGRLCGLALLGRQQDGGAETFDLVHSVGGELGTAQAGDEGLGVFLHEAGLGPQPFVGTDQEDLAGLSHAFIGQGRLDLVRGQAQGHDGHQPVAVEHGGGDEAPGLAQGGPVELEVRHPVVIDVLGAPERPYGLRQVTGGVGTGLQAGPQGGVGLVAEEDLKGVRVDQQDVLEAEPAENIPKPRVAILHRSPVRCGIRARRQGLGARVGPRRRDHIGRLGAPSRVRGRQEVLRVHRRVDPAAEGRREVAVVESRHGGPGRRIRRRVAQGPVAGPELGAHPAQLRQAGEGQDLVP